MLPLESYPIQQQTIYIHKIKNKKTKRIFFSINGNQDQLFSQALSNLAGYINANVVSDVQKDLKYTYTMYTTQTYKIIYAIMNSHFVFFSI